jgi:hypothetical protein
VADVANGLAGRAVISAPRTDCDAVQSGQACPFGDFADVLLAAALSDVGRREDDGPNRSAWIDALCDGAGIPRGSAYCGLAVRHWLEVVAKATGRATIAGSPLALAYAVQLRHARTWVPRAALAGVVARGWLLVWDRGGGHGHVEVVERVEDGIAHTVGANTKPPDVGDEEREGVWRMRRRLDDPELLGGGMPLLVG